MGVARGIALGNSALARKSNSRECDGKSSQIMREMVAVVVIESLDR